MKGKNWKKNMLQIVSIAIRTTSQKAVEQNFLEILVIEEGICSSRAELLCVNVTGS